MEWETFLRNRNKSYAGLLVFICMVISCKNPNSRIEAVYKLAPKNKEELQEVLIHYKNDKQKLAAAGFLLNNMFHSSKQSNLFEAYKTAVMESGDSIEYNAVWKNITDSIKPELPVKIHDAKVLTAGYLTANIDEAFRSWESSPWHNDIDFDTFCNYILPYRVLDEPVSDWRTHLNRKYHPFIEGVKCPKEAFGIIYRHILSEFKDRSHKCPFTPSAMMFDKMQEGTCSYRCIYLVSVLRSLGIPAAYDMVNCWANYSQGGHSWVAYVGNGGKTATMMPEDTVPKEGNYIDSSIFKPEVEYDASKFRYKVDSLKRISKVYRKNYKVKPDIGDTYSNGQLLFLNDFFLEDVSDVYGLNGQVSLTHHNEQQLFLCTFASIRDWQPVIKGNRKGGTTVFNHIGSDIVYLPVSFPNEQMTPVENPFILYDDGTKKTLTPDTAHRERVVLRRKYLLFAHWINRWSKMIGSGIEGSDDPGFKTCDRLYEFTEIPDGITRIGIEAERPYRYIRFQTPLSARPNIAEMRFYGTNRQGDIVQLAGNVIYKDIDREKVMLAFDDDYSTYTQTPVDHYWFGLDMGSKSKFVLSGVEFCMRHDMNMIEVGDNYELLFYDYGWRSLGEQTATCDSLVYNGVPAHSLLWLRNHTKGREERIFTYENGRQVWW